MSDKIFNSKYANELPRMSEEEAERAGFSTIEPTPAEQATEEKLRQINEQRRTKNRKLKNKKNQRKPSRSQLITITREKLRRKPLVDTEPDTTITPWSKPFLYKNPPLPREQRIERNIVDPERIDRVFNPARTDVPWDERMQQPASEESFGDNVRNRWEIGAFAATTDQILRENYPCPVCKGAFNGGKPLMPWWKKNEQEFCPGCMNHGYVLTRECDSCDATGNKSGQSCKECDGTGQIPTGDTPFEFFADLHKKLGAHNRAVFDHVDNCTPWACARGCELNKNGAIDQLRIAAQRQGKSLRNRDAWKITHPVPGASSDTLSLTAPYALNDQLRPLSPVFSYAGGREGSPISFGDAVVFTNHDTLNPTADFSTGRDPHYVQPGYQTYHENNTGSGYVATDRPVRINYKSDEEHQKAMEEWSFLNEKASQEHDRATGWREGPHRQSLDRRDDSLVRGFRSKTQTGFIVHTSKDGTKVWAVVLGSPLKDIRDERQERLKNNRREVTCDTCDGKGEIHGKNEEGKSIIRTCRDCDGDGVVEKGLDRNMRMDIDEPYDTNSYDDESPNDRAKKNKTLARIRSRFDASGKLVGGWEKVVNFIGEHSPVEIKPSSLKVSLVKGTPDQFARLTDANSAYFMTVGHYATRRGDSRSTPSSAEQDAFANTITPLHGGGNMPDQTLVYHVLNRKNHGLDTDSIHQWMLTTENNVARKWAFRVTKKIDSMRGLRPGDEGSITPAMLGGQQEEYLPQLPQSSEPIKTRSVSINGPRGEKSLPGRNTEIAGPPIPEEPEGYDIDRALGSMEDSFFGNCKPNCEIKHNHVREQFDVNQQAQAVQSLQRNGFNVGKALNELDDEQFSLPPDRSEGDINE